MNFNLFWICAYKNLINFSYPLAVLQWTHCGFVLVLKSSFSLSQSRTWTGDCKGIPVKDS